jgi:hypothetical protein
VKAVTLRPGESAGLLRPCTLAAGKHFPELHGNKVSGLRKQGEDWKGANWWPDPAGSIHTWTVMYVQICWSGSSHAFTESETLEGNR